MALADTLKQKRGPLPTYAWLALFIVALSGIMIYRKKKAAAAAASQDNGSGTTGNAGATNLGSNTLSNLTPTAYPMPIQQGDTFTNVTVNPATPTTPATPAKPVTPAAPKRATTYTVAAGDTWDTIGKKLNYAPVLLWEINGAPAGFKVPAKGTVLNLTKLSSDPGTIYANQAKIVASEKALAGG
jgi:nucleoid-associated protein YgaU